MFLKILIVACVATLAITTPIYCPKGCNCKENVAICNTINIQPTGFDILHLKIIHPEVPLILKNSPFKIRGLQNVNSISIENATILAIDNSVFTDLPLLSTFNVINSNIPAISNSNAFLTANGLKNLRIVNSTLKKFEFLKSRSIEELDLSNCQLTTISENTFTNLPQLAYINMANNNVSSIDPKAFSKLFFLQELILTNNHITKLDTNVFANNNELVSLDLSGNPLENIDINLVSELERLVLKNSNLHYFDQKLSQDLYLLNYLDLSDNKLNLSGNPFHSMEDLEHIDLSNNQLQTLDTHIFKSNLKLQKIVLDNNNFKVMPKFAHHHANFETYFFSCTNCGISTITIDTFKHFPMIVTLNLSHNHITGVNLTEMQYLRGLIEADLSYNNISVINPLSFIKSTALERLNLAGNPLKTLNSNVFRNNRALRILDLSFCQLENLWTVAKVKLPSLLKLNISHNSLSAINPRALNVTPSIAIFDIFNNPLECTESLKNAIIWLAQHHVSPFSNLPHLKTHEQISIPNTTKFEHSDIISSWKLLAKEVCSDDLNLTDALTEKPIIISVPKNNSKLVVSTVPDDEYDYDYSYEDSEYIKGVNKNEEIINLSDLAFGSVQFKKQNFAPYSFLFPTMVFIVTALSVLVIAAIVMLFILRTKSIPYINLPRVKIPGWNSNGKLKKHSGSVYQPLSEDKLDSSSLIIPEKEFVTINNAPPK